MFAFGPHHGEIAYFVVNAPVVTTQRMGPLTSVHDILTTVPDGQAYVVSAQIS